MPQLKIFNKTHNKGLNRGLLMSYNKSLIKNIYNNYNKKNN